MFLLVCLSSTGLKMHLKDRIMCHKDSCGIMRLQELLFVIKKRKTSLVNETKDFQASGNTTTSRRMMGVEWKELVTQSAQELFITGSDIFVLMFGYCQRVFN